MENNSDEDNPIFYGDRGEKFKKLIINLLEKGNISDHYIEKLTNTEAMKLYDQAFTSSTANPHKNFEVFEQMGDLTVNKFIVFYSLYKRFPQLFCTEGVKVVARLRINYGSKLTFSRIANNLGFWDFITASKEKRSVSKKDLLEDTLEAFFGVTEYILDKRFRHGVGEAIVYDILTSIFDNIPMSIKFEDLYDAKTRLKQTFDSMPNELGVVSYKNHKDQNTKLNKTICYRTYFNGTRKVEEKIGVGIATDKKYAEQKAAEEALKYLKNLGYYRKPPPEYAYFLELENN